MQAQKSGRANSDVDELASVGNRYSPARNLSPPLSDHYNNVKKRNRISFVCQACRTSKTKCDREKPTCGRCAQHGITCIYDVEKQPAPKNPSKDAKIARLEKDLEYWKSKAIKQWSSGEEGVLANPLKRPFIKDDNGPQKMSKIPNEVRTAHSAIDDTIDDIQINIYKSHPSIIMNRIMKREVKPLSENYAITQDKFLSGLIASVFLEGSKNTMIPALTANASVGRARPSVRDNALKLKEILLRQCHTEPQRIRINDFTERILQNTNSNKYLRLGMLPASVQGVFDRLSIEDYCAKDGEYSALLKYFVDEIESLLPPIHVINKYKQNFYDSIFPKLPFLNVPSFEESLSHTLVPNTQDPSKVKINLGSSRIRAKIENLSILLVVLKLSYISLRFIEDSSPGCGFTVEKEIIEDYPIGNDYIVLAENCLLAENLYSCTNENILTCLLYIWSFFVYSPEEGDFFLEHPTDVLSGLIIMLATSIGLHRDPSEFPQLKTMSESEPGILNHRRILWIGITTTICFESCLKGRYPLSLEMSMNQFIDIRNPNSLDIYLERVKRDMTTDDPEFLKLHECGFRQALLGLLISDLDKMTLNYKTSFSLASFEALREKIDQYVQGNPYAGIMLEKSVAKDNTGKAVINEHKIHDFIGQHPLTMGKLILLRSSMALFFHFEARLSKERHLIQYYKRYFIKVCVDSMSLVNCIVNIFGEGYIVTSLPTNNYNITKAAQMALCSNFFGLLGMIMRIELAGNMLFLEFHDDSTKAENEKLRQYGQKMDCLSALKKDLEKTLEGIYNVASKHLRFTYYSVFKMLALFDVIIQRLRKGELWSSILILEHVKEMNPSSVKGLSMNLSLDLESDINIVDQLKGQNFLGDLSVRDIHEIYQEIRVAINRTPVVASDNTHTGYHNLNASSSLSSPSLDNLTKLSTAATMNQNFDFQTNICQKNTDLARSLEEAKTQFNMVDSTGNRQGTSTYPKKYETGASTTADTDTANANADAGTEADEAMEFPGLFGGLDLFDYDFLFSNEL